MRYTRDDLEVERYLVRARLDFFFFQAEDGIRDYKVTGVQTCALPILGAGGGGDTYTSLLAARHAIERFGPVGLVDLDDLPDDALIMPCGGVGAPVVSIEKLGTGEEGRWLRDGLEQVRGERVAALMAGEIGGANGMQPIN